MPVFITKGPELTPEQRAALQKKADEAAANFTAEDYAEFKEKLEARQAELRQLKQKQEEERKAKCN